MSVCEFPMKNAPQNMRRSLLSEPYLADLLLYINDKKEISASDLLKVHSYYRKISNLVSKLESLGLVIVNEEKDKKSGRMKKKIRLTKQGKKGASLVEKFNEIVIESESAPMRTNTSDKGISVKAYRVDDIITLRMLDNVLIPRSAGGSCLLQKDDVMNFPREVANALIDDDKAEEIESIESPDFEKDN